MRESSVQRVVGKLPEETKEKTLRQLDDRFLNQNFPELAGKEKDKTPEESRVIEVANAATNEILREYGLEPVDIPPRNVHIIKKDAWPWEDRGQHQPLAQAVLMPEEKSRIVSVSRIAHELLHFKSYTALQLPISDDNYYATYRLGLVAVSRDGKEVYFTNLNEGVTEELIKQHIEKFFADPFFVDEVRGYEEIVIKFKGAVATNGKLLINDDTLYAEASGPDQQGNWEVNTETFGCVKARGVFNMLVDKLFERNRDTFGDRKEVFDLFAKGMLTGNLLPIGKIVDNTFGTGTFRKIAELDKEIDKFAEYVDSLE